MKDPSILNREPRKGRPALNFGKTRRDRQTDRSRSLKMVQINDSNTRKAAAAGVFRTKKGLRILFEKWHSVS